MEIHSQVVLVEVGVTPLLLQLLTDKTFWIRGRGVLLVSLHGWMDPVSNPPRTYTTTSLVLVLLDLHFVQVEFQTELCEVHDW